MQPTKRHTLQTLFGLSMAAALLATAAAPAAAQTFPNRQVNLMVPYPAGGLSDAIARTVEKPLAKALGRRQRCAGGTEGAKPASRWPHDLPGLAQRDDPGAAGTAGG